MDWLSLKTLAVCSCDRSGFCMVVRCYRQVMRRHQGAVGMGWWENVWQQGKRPQGECQTSVNRWSFAESSEDFRSVFEGSLVPITNQVGLILSNWSGCWFRADRKTDKHPICLPGQSRSGPRSAKTLPASKKWTQLSQRPVQLDLSSSSPSPPLEKGTYIRHKLGKASKKET